MSNINPIISVLMPVYNAERYVAAAVESILNQTFVNFTFLIIDDGSNDGSPDILNKYAKRDSRIRLISRPNIGIVGALNHGLEMCGELVTRMDADDIALPNRLRAQAEFLQVHSEYVAVGSRVLLIDEDGWPIRESCTAQTHEEIDAAHIGGAAGMICHPAVMFRSEAVRRLGGYRDAFPTVEDLDLFLRLAEVGRLANLLQVFTHYRMHAKSIGHERQLEQMRAIWAAVADARARRGLPDYDTCEAAIETTMGVPTVAMHHRKWAWWALGAGNVRTARKHAVKALRIEPTSIESWRLFYCAMRGH